MVRTLVTPSAKFVSCATFLFLPHFDVICDLLLNRCVLTWNLFVNQNFVLFQRIIARKKLLFSHWLKQCRKGKQCKKRKQSCVHSSYLAKTVPEHVLYCTCILGSRIANNRPHPIINFFTLGEFWWAFWETGWRLARRRSFLMHFFFDKFFFLPGFEVNQLFCRSVMLVGCGWNNKYNSVAQTCW